MTVLQHRIRRIAADPDVAPTVAGDLTKAADAISVTRADRSNAASHDLPSPLILLSFVAGIVLTLTSARAPRLAVDPPSVARPSASVECPWRAGCR